MELKYKLWGLLLILSLAQVTHAQLQCYVCENCAEVTTSTPLLNCDEDFFNPSGNNEPSTQTTTKVPTVTTEMPTEIIPTSTNTAAPTSTETSSSTSDRTSTVSSTESTTTPITTVPTESNTAPITSTEGTSSESSTMSSNSSSSTTTMTSTTKDALSSSTTEHSTMTTESTTHVDTTTIVETDGPETTTNKTANTGSTTSTVPQPPTPSTVHPPTTMPTPPNPGSETPIDDSAKYSVNGTDSDHASTKPYIASSQFRLRQARSVSDYTYHCLKVTASVNGSMVTSRGCSRVKATESVCGQWKEQHPTEQLNKCHPCSNTRCNGSTALNLSLGALVLTLVAAVLQRK